MTTARYRGRFAPSPTGPLHAGSLVAALASWLDAKAHQGTWLIRIEDIDPPRCPAGCDQIILQQLSQCGLHPDEPPIWQSDRHHHYSQALDQLLKCALAYPCGCTRKDIETAWALSRLAHARHIERPYPGTCRNGLNGKSARSWRFALTKYIANYQQAPLNRRPNTAFRLCNDELCWVDRRLGPQQQTPALSCGDFVLQRADGLFAYQLAVVVDDALQGITHIVRGEDLTDNTARQLLLQSALQLTHPRYMHTPLLRMPDGEKLSKQHGAPAVDVSDPVRALNQAAQHLQLHPVSPETKLEDALGQWVQEWQATYNVQRD